MAMLRNKNKTFSLILMCLIVVSPMANAQTCGLGGLLGGITSISNIQGLVMCSINGIVSTSNATSIPPFPNAGVTLQCSGLNVTSTTTNTNGVFSLPTNALSILSSTLLSTCKIIVTTPLTTCNASLPSVGMLSAPLTLAATNVAGGLNIFQLVPSIPFIFAR